jgi:hypothetical protein
VEIKCFHSLAQVRPFRAQLDALNRGSRQKDPFATLSFLENFAAHDQYYPRDNEAEPWFLVAFENGAPVAYLALRRIVERVLGLPSPKLEFFATHDVNCPHLVCAPDDEDRCSEAFYEYLLSRADEWRFLEFHQQDSSSRLTPPPAGVNLAHYYLRTFPTLENNAVSVRWSSLGAYYNAMSPHFRTDVRRKMRSLFAAGELSYVSSTDPRSTPVLLELLQSVEARSWRSDNECAIWGHPDRADYFRGLLAPEQSMRLHLGVVLLNGDPIAGAIQGDYEKTLYTMVIMFDASCERLGPGAALMLMGMNFAIEGGFHTVNMLSGFSYYKKRWLADARPTVSGQVFRVGKPRYWKLLAGDLKRRITRPHRAPPLLFNPVRRESTSDTQPLSPAERARNAGLLKQLRGLPVQWLGSEELTALMPFSVGPAGKKNRTG